jgi:hypothetical protein
MVMPAASVPFDLAQDKAPLTFERLQAIADQKEKHWQCILAEVRAQVVPCVCKDTAGVREFAAPRCCSFSCQA